MDTRDPDKGWAFGYKEGYEAASNNWAYRKAPYKDEYSKKWNSGFYRGYCDSKAGTEMPLPFQKEYMNKKRKFTLKYWKWMVDKALDDTAIDFYSFAYKEICGEEDYKKAEELLNDMWVDFYNKNKNK